MIQFKSEQMLQGKQSVIDKARMEKQRILLLLCALIGFVHAQTTPTPGCWYEGLCGFDLTDEAALTIPDANATSLDTMMEWCYNQCSQPDCTDFTVFTGNGRIANKCFLLTTCDGPDREADCFVAGTCNSGPANCESNDNCPMLPAPAPGLDLIPWTCDHDVNPYVQQIPDGTACFLSCNAWLDDNGEQATIESRCEAGAWVASTVLPNGPDDSLNAVLPNPLPKPDSPEEQQTACGCGVYDMRWVNSGTSALVDYDPNTLIGTDFLCTGGEYITTEADGELKFKLTPGIKCRMFCDNYHITTMECVNGLWTGQPELGAW